MAPALFVSDVAGAYLQYLCMAQSIAGDRKRKKEEEKVPPPPAPAGKNCTRSDDDQHSLNCSTSKIRQELLRFQNAPC